jgi:hypothetical protein
VLVLKDKAGGMGETRTTHAFEVGVGIPVKIVSLALDHGIEGSEVGHNHIIGMLTPVRRFPCCEEIGIPDECCFCVVN